MESQCQYCSRRMFYSCVKCQCSVCNQPECATSVPPSTSVYSEDHPKQVGLCKNRKSVKKKANKYLIILLKKVCLVFF